MLCRKLRLVKYSHLLPVIEKKKKLVNIGFEISIFFHPISMRLVCYCFCSKNNIFGIENSFHKVFGMHRILSDEYYSIRSERTHKLKAFLKEEKDERKC